MSGHIVTTKKKTNILQLWPAFCDSVKTDSTAAFSIEAQFPYSTWSSTPIAPAFVFTPQKNAVAVPAESGVCWSVLYVWIGFEQVS